MNLVKINRIKDPEVMQFFSSYFKLYSPWEGNQSKGFSSSEQPEGLVYFEQ